MLSCSQAAHGWFCCCFPLCAPSPHSRSGSLHAGEASSLAGLHLSLPYSFPGLIFCLLQRQAQWLPWARNVASQDYDVGGGRVRNRGEIWGSQVFVTVEGELVRAEGEASWICDPPVQLELQPDRTFTPKMFQADIQSGTLHGESSVPPLIPSPALPQASPPAFPPCLLPCLDVSLAHPPLSPDASPQCWAYRFLSRSEVEVSLSFWSALLPRPLSPSSCHMLAVSRSECSYLPEPQGVRYFTSPVAGLLLSSPSSSACVLVAPSSLCLVPGGCVGLVTGRQSRSGRRKGW